ncbi:hypothetical protein M747DRAFT_157244 [Aspergillus niger ATCC 13496]|uniref:Uncharacterized protein n=1 Tax=Aspergillus niger ATCC 13496 TaxID=1353008 RepID=A0A370BJY2_ASPNG|nr:hypothetical protein M747DRAFT_157244 [Aspergillus niger ATCC 13496]
MEGESGWRERQTNRQEVPDPNHLPNRDWRTFVPTQDVAWGPIMKMSVASTQQRTL